MTDRPTWLTACEPCQRRMADGHARRARCVECLELARAEDVAPVPPPRRVTTIAGYVERPGSIVDWLYRGRVIQPLRGLGE